MLALNADNDTVGSTHQLICKQQNRLETEFPVAEVEEVLEGWSEEIDDHGVVVAFGAEPANERYTDATGESLVDFGFILELGVLGLDRFELDGDFFTGDDVDSQVNITCGGGLAIPDDAAEAGGAYRKILNRSFCPTCTCHRPAGRACGRSLSWCFRERRVLRREKLLNQLRCNTRF